MGYLFNIILLAALTSCAYYNAMRSPSADYQSYIRRNIEEKRIYDRGKLIMSAYALQVDRELKMEQEKMSPSRSIKLENDKVQFVVAVNYVLDPTFRRKNFKWKFGDLEASKVKEIYSYSIIESHYTFAYPYHRLFHVQFEKKDIINFDVPFSVHSPSGSLVFERPEKDS